MVEDACNEDEVEGRADDFGEIDETNPLEGPFEEREALDGVEYDEDDEVEGVECWFEIEDVEVDEDVVDKCCRISC